MKVRELRAAMADARRGRRSRIDAVAVATTRRDDATTRRRDATRRRGVTYASLDDGTSTATTDADDDARRDRFERR